jgi:cold shock protein
LATGRVLQFDHARGYGFVTADDGGEDIFLHASVFDGDSEEITPGTRIEFKVMEGDRGRKAFAVRLIEDEPEPAPWPGPRPSPPSVTPSVLATVITEPDEEPTCDVLSAEEFRRELTEMLIGTVPDLTGQQVLQIRLSLLDLAKKHGWSDG